MQVPVVLTLIGPDRPGLVDLLASTIARHQGNWLESRMAHLAGQFAGILRVDVPAENQPALTEALQQLGKQGMTVVLHAEPTPTTPAAPGTLIQLHLLGHDRPGIVHQISSTLARHHVNVEELETGTESAPMTGEILFRTHAQLRLPPQIDLQALRTELERIAADLMVDLTLKPVTPTNP